MPILIFSANDDTNNYLTQGEGTLPDISYGRATGGLTDQTLLNFHYPINGHNVELIEENKIVQATINEFQDPQRLRIVSVKKSLSGRQYEVKAEPIFNDIRRYFIPEVGSTETMIDPLSAFNLIKSNTVPPLASKFKFQSELTSQGTFHLEGVNTLEAFGGTDGSMLDTFGGEYIRDNLTLYAYKAFGKENVTQLVYGKNIKGLDMEVNTENIIIGIYPFAKYNSATGGESEITVTLDEKILKYETADTFPNGRILPVDFSQEFGEEETPTQAKLRTKATTYMNQAVNYNKSTPLINVKVDFLALDKFSEYYDFQALQRVGLGDTVTVYYPPLGIDVETRVIKYEFDIPTQQYTKLELGQVKANFYQKLQDNIKDVEDQIKDNDFSGIYDDIQDAIQDASDQITGNKGGNVVLSPAMQPEEIMIMDTDNKDTAKDVLRLNKSGIGFSRTGYNGTYTTAWTISGQFNADFITAGTLKAINIQGVNISGSVIKSDGADFSITMDNGSIDWFRKSDNKKAGTLKGSLFRGSSTLTYSVAQESSGGGFLIESPFLNTEAAGLPKNVLSVVSTNSSTFGSMRANELTLKTSGAYDQSNPTNTRYATIDMYSNRDPGFMTISQKSTATGALVNIDIRNGNFNASFGNYTFANLKVTGSKNALIYTQNYGARLMHAYETPSVLFGDYGTGVTNDTGVLRVELDPMFGEVCNLKKAYQVFVTPSADCSFWVDEKDPTGFTIYTSEPNVTVDWNIVASRIRYEAVRFATPEQMEENEPYNGIGARMDDMTIKSVF